MPALRQREGALLALQRLLGQPLALEVRGPGEPRARALGHQADLHAAPRLVGGQQRLLRRRAQVADAAEDIEFITGQRQLQRHLLRHLPRAAAAAGAGRGSQRRQPLRLGLAEGGARLVDLQRGHAQVAVLSHGQVDDAAQALVQEHRMPVERGSVGRGRCGGGVARRHGGIGPAVVRREVDAAGQHQRGGQHGDRRRERRAG